MTIHPALHRRIPPAINVRIHASRFVLPPINALITETQAIRRHHRASETIRPTSEVMAGAAMALWFLNFSTWDGVADIAGTCSIGPGFLPPRRPVACCRRWPQNASTTATPVGLVGAELEFRCNRTVTASAGNRSTKWTIYRLSGPRLAALCRASITPGGPADRKRTEQQYQARRAMIPTGIPIAG